MKTLGPAIKAPIDPDNPNYYLDKSQLHAALKAHKVACLAAEEKGDPSPQTPEYVGACFLSIARGLAQKYNFRSYSYVNDMISDGLMSCLKYVRSYDPDRIGVDGKPTSPLSYFTQTCYNAFIDRIKKEKKQTRVKRALIMSANFDTFSVSGDDDAADYSANLNEFIMSLGSDDEELDKKIRELNEAKDKDNAKPSPLDVLWDDEEKDE
jgi:DNA-directed RNA polymerase specialized sigma24 family protein